MDSEKYQVFISSPFLKLKRHRKAAVEAVVNWGHIPIALENFSAKAAKDHEVISKAISDCQIYILIMGHHCGSVMPGSDITYTEFEFKAALEKGMDILAFMEDLEEAKEEISEDKNIKNKGIETNRLENFHVLVGDEERIFYRPWNKNTNLEEVFSRGIGELTNQEGGVSLPGWIRAREQERERTVQMALDNIFARDMVRNINGFKKLNERCGIDVGEKESLATCFRDTLSRQHN